MYAFHQYHEVYDQKQTREKALFQDVTIDDETIKTYTKPIKAIQVCKFFCV
jgi:hypothetical protein